MRQQCHVTNCNVKRKLWPRVVEGVTYWFCSEHKKVIARPNVLVS